MKLSIQLAKSFLEVYKPLLEYVFFVKYGRPTDSIEEYKEAKDILFDNFALSDDYLASNKELTAGQKEIIHNLKLGINGTFIYLKTLKKYSLLIDPSTNEIYCVLGLNDSFKELGLSNYQIIETTILDFNNVIICDGLISFKDISLGQNMRYDINDLYKTKKKHKKLNFHISKHSTGPLAPRGCGC